MNGTAFTDNILSYFALNYPYSTLNTRRTAAATTSATITTSATNTITLPGDLCPIVLAPTVWNTLPSNVQLCDSMLSFKYFNQNLLFHRCVHAMLTTPALMYLQLKLRVTTATIATKPFLSPNQQCQRTEGIE